MHVAVKKIDQLVLPGASLQQGRRLVPRPRESTDHSRCCEHHGGRTDGQRDGGAERPYRTAAEHRQQQCPRVAEAGRQARPNTVARHQKFVRTLVKTALIVSGSVASYAAARDASEMRLTASRSASLPYAIV